MAQKQDAGAKTVLTGPLVWTSERHSILVNNQKVAIKGINWFGFGTWLGCGKVGWGGRRRLGALRLGVEQRGCRRYILAAELAGSFTQSCDTCVERKKGLWRCFIAVAVIFETQPLHAAPLLPSNSFRLPSSPFPPPPPHPTPHFPLETTDNCVHGLWDGLSKSLSDYLDLVQTHGFNALRLPFSVKLALALDTTFPKPGFIAADPSLAGLSCGQIMDKLVVECGKRGIVVMLDQHRLDPDRGISDLWFDEGFEEPVVLLSWEVMVGRFKKYWNVFALDLKNEPHGCCTWGSGEAFTDWKAASERIIKFIAKNHPDFQGLFFVSGIWGGGGHWWGGNLRGMRSKPVELGEEGLNKRVVYTPHVYGPDVHPQTYFSSWSFPNNLPAIWDLHWGFLREQGGERGTGGRAVVVSEWGGFCRGKDAKWQERVARYLRERGMADNFYWWYVEREGRKGGREGRGCFICLLGGCVLTFTSTLTHISIHTA